MVEEAYSLFLYMGLSTGLFGAPSFILMGSVPVCSMGPCLVLGMYLGPDEESIRRPHASDRHEAIMKGSLRGPPLLLRPPHVSLFKGLCLLLGGTWRYLKDPLGSEGG